MQGKDDVGKKISHRLEYYKTSLPRKVLVMTKEVQGNPEVVGFFDPSTWTVTYVVHGGVGSACAIIDSVLDYDSKSGRTKTESADQVIAFVEKQQLQVQWILETHAHADHLTAAPYLKRLLGGKIGIGRPITQVQKVFKGIFNLGEQFCEDGSQFDALFENDETFLIGDLSVHVMAVPGHTPACMAYRVGDAVFVGDTLFMPDVGTARCDFPGGDAKTLYASIQRLLSLPASTRLFMCHDYPPAGRPVTFETTVAEQRSKNIHIHDGISEAQFIEMRKARDASLDMPTLLLPSIQVNIRGGEMPPAESNGTSYIKIPINAL
jgi:glyoxylase-like metal-dependent hydrolase (beta-lactamase superfamily II)